MVNTKELSEYLKIHINTIYSFIEEGMPHYQVGSQYRFKIEEVEMWLREKEQKNSNK